VRVHAWPHQRGYIGALAADVADRVRHHAGRRNDAQLAGRKVLGPLRGNGRRTARQEGGQQEDQNRQMHVPPKLSSHLSLNFHHVFSARTNTCAAAVRPMAYCRSPICAVSGPSNGATAKTCTCAPG